MCATNGFCLSFHVWDKSRDDEYAIPNINLYLEKKSSNM